MADRILEFLNNLLKIGKEQFFLKSTFLRNKVPIKPVLGLTGLGVLFIAVRPLLSNGDDSDGKGIPARTSSSIKTPKKEKAEGEEEYTLQKTLYLMREKEKLLKKQENALQQQS